MISRKTFEKEKTAKIVKYREVFFLLKNRKKSAISAKTKKVKRDA
jgi:hypothetical protein